MLAREIVFMKKGWVVPKRSYSIKTFESCVVKAIHEMELSEKKGLARRCQIWFDMG